MKFHDPDVQWRFRITGGEHILTVGSEDDRIRLVFTREELQQIFAQYAESQLTDRQWITGRSCRLRPKDNAWLKPPPCAPSPPATGLR